MLTLIEEVEEYGYDMTSIRSEIATGDLDTAGTLMLRFLEDHGDELPLSTIGEYTTCIPGTLATPNSRTTMEQTVNWNEERSTNPGPSRCGCRSPDMTAPTAGG